MSRVPTWEPRLHALIAGAMHRPFSWGSHDCALWGADVVLALTGTDHGAAFRGTYDDAAGAAAALRTHGAGTITRTFDRHLERITPGLAQRGDLVMIGNGRAGSIGVCMGALGWFVSDEGLISKPRPEWSRAWRA